MSSAVSQIRKDAGRTPAEWLLETFDENPARGLLSGTVTVRPIVQLIDDHLPNCIVCFWLEEDTLRAPDAMYWQPGDPTVP